MKVQAPSNQRMMKRVAINAQFNYDPYDTSTSDLNKDALALSEVNELNGETGDLIIMMPSLSSIIFRQKSIDDLTQEDLNSTHTWFSEFLHVLSN